MNDLTKQITAVLATAFLSVTTVFSADYNMQKSTPVGSWQLRQVISTDEKGNQSLQEVRTSLVGEETRNKVDYVWIEMATDTFKMKKGNKDKPTGEHIVMKILMEKSLMSGDPEDIFNNLQGLGAEIIMQTGDQEPMKIEAGGMMSGMMQSMGPEIDYKFKELGHETIKVPAGKFKCKVVEGEGTAEMKIVFKTIRVNGKSKQWTSDKVPFGIVKMESTSEMSGKETKTEAVLLSCGDSGAVSEIRGQPQSIKLPSLGGLFGN
jgi:hypothetical protein